MHEARQYHVDVYMGGFDVVYSKKKSHLMAGYGDVLG